MPHRAFWDRSAGQVYVTGLDFAESDFAVSDYASFCPASSGISHMQHLALPQVTLFHILIGNWFRSVSFPPMSITTPPPELISILIHIDFSAWKVSSYTVALLLIQNVRASEELPKISFPGTEYCCSTISYEGVCNIFRDSNNNVYELSYPLR